MGDTGMRWGAGGRRLRTAALGVAVALVAGLTVGQAAPASPDGSRIERGTITYPSGPSPLVTPYCSEPTQGTFAWTIEGVRPGWVFALTANPGSEGADFDITFYSAPPVPCDSKTTVLQHRNKAGDEHAVVPAKATLAVVTLNVGAAASFTYEETIALGAIGPTTHHSPTVVAVIDVEGFSPYHNDFLAGHHPWGDAIDFGLHPSTYVDGYPTTAPSLTLDLPETDGENVNTLRLKDAPTWATMKKSTADAPNMYWLPGTKVIGALNFSSTPFAGPNDSHATTSTASAVGNIHGTCPECLVVMINAGPGALEWATSQDWIDVVTNSYEQSWVGSVANAVLPVPGVLRDSLWWGGEDRLTKAATEKGQSVVWAAGNGLVAGALQSPPQPTTYVSSQRGPDWVVTVGGVLPDGQKASGAGKPVDISSVALNYPSTGGTTADGAGKHSGTSNATPVVAGTLAKVIQMGRDLLQDDDGRHADGVVGQGMPVKCAPQSRIAPGLHRLEEEKGGGQADCPLGDGILTRDEVEDTVFHNVLPWPMHDLQYEGGPLNGGSGVLYPRVPTTAVAFAYVGHGVVRGTSDPTRFALEQLRFFDALQRRGAKLARPVGEEDWMIADSRCRQRLWGTWGGGYYHGQDWPTVETHPAALGWDGWCSAFVTSPMPVLEEQVGQPPKTFRLL